MALTGILPNAAAIPAVDGNNATESVENMFHEIAKKFYGEEIFHQNGDVTDKSNFEFGVEKKNVHESSGTLSDIDNRAVYDVINNLNETNDEEIVVSKRFKMVDGVAKCEDVWFETQDTLSWAFSKIAAYNPFQKIFRCVDCDCEGFMSRVAEHWLGSHGNIRAFQCPRCPYTSAWARCVRMHLSKHHNEPCADNSLWKGNKVLEDITNLLLNLKNKVEKKFERYNIQTRNEKRYVCSNCAYSTDRKDLFTRHENIHKDEKPFQCYVCEKQFNRADHVKKHFLRIHKDVPYDISRIRKFPSKNRPIKADPYPVMYLNENVTISPLQPQITNIKVESTEDSADMTPVKIKEEPSSDTEPPPSQSNCVNPSIEIPNYEEIKLNITKRLKLEQECKKEKQKFYSCPYCTWKGADNWCLKRHLNTHIKPYGCCLCGYKAARPERLGTHVYKIHHKRVCTKCTTCFDDAESLAEHIFEMHQPGFSSSSVSCPTCGKSLESLSDLEVHYIIYHRQNEKYVNGIDSDTHDNTSSPVNDSITHLEGESNDSNEFPKDYDHQVTGFACLDCGCSFANKESFETHKKLHNSAPSADQIPKVTYKCSLCNYGCWSQQLMMDHIRVHTGIVWECKAGNCSFVTLEEDILQQHVDSLHNDSSVIRCPHCGLLINSLKMLDWHHSEHHLTYCCLCAQILKSHFGVREILDPTCKNNVVKEWVYDTSSKCLYPKGLNPIMEVHQTLEDYDTTRMNNKRNRKQTCPRKVMAIQDVKKPSHRTGKTLWKRKPKRFCARCKLSFCNITNHLLHIKWRHWKRRSHVNK